MLRHNLKKLIAHGHSHLILSKSLIQHNKAAFPILFDRSASTHAKQPPSTMPTRPIKKRLVEVTSPFSKANKLLYVLPEDPYHASEKVTRILKIGTIEDAADYVKALPIYLQSAIVWNQLIGHCAKYGKSSFAEKYYSQLRKRGFEPNERTITHMLEAYANSDSPNAIEKAESWFAKLKDFKITPSIYHFNSLMRVYNNANSPEKTIETLKYLQKREDISPDAVTYTVALWACPQLTQLNKAEEIEHIWNDIIYRVDKTERRTPTKTVSLLAQKALEISMTEGSIVRPSKMKETPLQVDDALVVALLNAVSRSARSKTNALVGVEMIDRFYSLCPPRAAEIMQKNGIQLSSRKPGFGFQPSLKVLDSILRFSGNLKEFKLGEQYFDLAKQQYPRLEPDTQVHNSLSFLQKKSARKQK